jgi:Pyruvate/2-oxoglutarate dehydrogenase complex, dihydrolipoamide acyltransferase (E2) component, and related enzymes
MSDVTLPALGESVTEGTVTRWLKAVGDTVAVDEPLVEISTDKVDTEIPSPVAGVVKKSS